MPTSPTSLHSISRMIRRVDVRFINKVRTVSFSNHELRHTALDSHADTSCAGSNFAVLELSGEKLNVTPFSEHYSAVPDVPIATAVTIWEDPRNGEIWALVVHEALYFGGNGYQRGRPIRKARGFHLYHNGGRPCGLCHVV